MKLYLVRHGVSTGNIPGQMIGWSDHPLSPLGVEQARAVAARLAPLGPMPVYASDLPRAAATARVIAAEWAHDGPEPDVRPDARLREIDLGDLEGSSWDDFMADEGLQQAFAAEPFETRLPGGESLALLQSRVVGVFREILAGDDDIACIVAHDGPIRSILNHVLQAPPARWWTLATSHGGLSLVESDGDWVSLRCVNDTSHLEAVAESGRQATDTSSGRISKLARLASEGAAASDSV